MEFKSLEKDNGTALQVKLHGLLICEVLKWNQNEVIKAMISDSKTALEALFKLSWNSKLVKDCRRCLYYHDRGRNA